MKDDAVASKKGSNTWVVGTKQTPRLFRIQASDELHEQSWAVSISTPH